MRFIKSFQGSANLPFLGLKTALMGLVYHRFYSLYPQWAVNVFCGIKRAEKNGHTFFFISVVR
jgi:hypothetical protein